MWIREHRNGTPMRFIHEIAHISRQGYFQAVKREKYWGMFYQRLKETVLDVREGHRSMGSRMMFHKLSLKEIGVNTFEKFMSTKGLTVALARKRIITTDSRGGGPVFPNLTNGLRINNINQLIAGDITYFICDRGTYYISMLTDVYSMRILGARASDNMMALNNYLVLQTMFKVRGQVQFSGMIHHTDKGSQYRSGRYLQTLQKAGIAVSMARTCLENPYAERINGIIKNDYLRHEKICTLNELQIELRRAVHKYNNERPQLLLGWRSPVEFESHIKTLNNRQRQVKTLHDFNGKDNGKKS